MTVGPTEDWSLPAAALAEALISRHGLTDFSAAAILHALSHIDQFYDTRVSTAMTGEVIPVTSSPIPRHSGRALLRVATEIGVQRTFEVGFAFGMSTCHLLAAHEICRGQQHIAIDPFQQSEYYRGCGLVNAWSTGLAGRLLWLKEESRFALPRLMASPERFDLGFIDGSHIFADMFIDAYYGFHLLRDGGILILDDGYLGATKTLAAILISNFGMTHRPTPDAPNLIVLAKEGQPRLDWTKFETEFVKFPVY